MHTEDVGPAIDTRQSTYWLPAWCVQKVADRDSRHIQHIRLKLDTNVLGLMNVPYVFHIL
jgi:hypothetical protein